jgi:hypothetical protein
MLVSSGLTLISPLHKILSKSQMKSQTRPEFTNGNAQGIFSNPIIVFLRVAFLQMILTRVSSVTATTWQC